LRRRSVLSACITGVVFVGALVYRSAWLRDARFHPDESTILWMALDAVRDLQLPDHGLVSSYHVFQPPGLVWMTMPFVALGGGRPEVVIVAFALLNAAAIAFLVATVGRFWGLLYAAVLGSFLTVGPDAYFSAAVWHPSLYTGAMALMLGAGIRLGRGSAWWALPLVAVPGWYALIHYSGFIVYAPAVVLLALSRRKWRILIVPVLSGVVLVACAWGPFLSFEIGREWRDLTTLADTADSSSTVGAKLRERFSAFVFAVSHLGQSLDGAVHLTGVIWALVLLAFLIAVIRTRWRDPGFAVPAATLVSGVTAQVVVDQGERVDVLLVWLVPLYALAAWAVVQTVELARLARARRPFAPALAVVVVVLVAVLGSIDLANKVRSIPYEERLSDKWRAARADAPVRYDAGVRPASSLNRFYLPCDPPWDWGSEIWYLEEVLHSGSGRRAAVEGGAFRWRAGPPCIRK
jgi:hypothetical protein